MKHIPRLPVPILLLGLAGGVATSALHAAAPVIASVKAEQVLYGETMSLGAVVTDSDGNLQAVSFHGSGAGLAGTQLLGTCTVSGSSASVSLVWAPPAAGAITITVTAGDTLAESASVSRTTYAYAERVTVSGVDLADGEDAVFVADGELRTKENTSAEEVVAESGSTMLFWARTRVVLKPGFHAEAGAVIWAATDADLDGYSDLEEATDSDGDGMCDAWESDHGLNPSSAADAAVDSDGDGLSNLTEYLANTDPHDATDGAALPSGYQLVLRLPSGSFAGLETSNWTLTGVASP